MQNYLLEYANNRDIIFSIAITQSIVTFYIRVFSTVSLLINKPTVIKTPRLFIKDLLRLYYKRISQVFCSHIPYTNSMKTYNRYNSRKNNYPGNPYILSRLNFASWSNEKIIHHTSETQKNVYLRQWAKNIPGAFIRLGIIPYTLCVTPDVTQAWYALIYHQRSARTFTLSSTVFLLSGSKVSAYPKRSTVAINYFNLSQSLL